MPVDFHQATLANGLTVLAETNPDAHTAAAGFFVRTGARDEDPALMGVSHFLEHMMFKGTEKRSADDVNRDFDSIGAKFNAYTTAEVTCFHAHVLPERLGEATDILADILRPALRDDDFATEKSVILEEIAMYQDSPFWVLFEETLDRHYRGHPLGHRVLGTAETVAALPRERMLQYFRDRYSGDNTVVALAGRIDFDAAVRDIEARCGAWQSTRPARDSRTPAPRPASEFTIESERVNRAYCLSLCPAPPLQDERRYAAMMLALVLGGPDSSRLHWALIEPGIAEEAQCAYEPHDGAGHYALFFSSAPESAQQAAAILDAEIARLIDSLTTRDLDSMRTKVATSVTLAGERPSGRMQRVGRIWTYLRSYLTLEEELERINAVTLDDLRAVHQAFPFAPRTTGMLRPKA